MIIQTKTLDRHTHLGDKGSVESLNSQLPSVTKQDALDPAATKLF